MAIIFQTLPIPSTEKGVPGGIPTLDENGKIPLSQLPPAVGGDGDVLSVNGVAPDGDGDVAISTDVIGEGLDNLYYTRTRFDAAFAEEIVPTTTSIGLVQTELNLTQGSAGLTSAGSFIADATTNFLTTATSLKDSDKKLDTALKVVADGLTSEVSTRQSADATILAALGTLTTEVDGIGLLADTMRHAVGLTTAGSFVTKTTSNYLNSSLTVDQSTVLLDGALKAVSNRVGTLELDPTTKSYVDAGLALKATAASLAAEISRAQLAEADLQDQIDELVSADTNFALITELNHTQASAGLTSAGSFIADATTNYLQTAISLKDSDKKLDSALKVVADGLASEVSTRQSADSALADDISAEGVRALAAELSLQGQIDIVESSAGLGTNGLYAPPENSQFLGSTTSLKSALAALDTNLATVFTDFNQHHLHTNSFFVNSDSDPQTVHDLTDFGQGAVAYMASGSYGGNTLTLSKQNFAIQAPYVGIGTTICELSGGRGVTISGATCTRVRLSNLQIEGDLTLGTSEGRHIFTNCEIFGSTSISNTPNFVTFTDCSFVGGITIASSVSATIYFVRCSFGGQLVSSSVASPLQVILADCSGIHASQTNLVSKVALVGRTGYASGAVVQITNAANFVYDLGTGSSTTFSGAYSELRGKPNLVTASTGLSDSATILRTSDLGTTVAPLSGGKIDMQFIPATVLTDVHVVADEAERLAIPDLIEGDYAIQTDNGSQWIYSGSAWYQVSSSGGGISTVNGKTGSSITLTTDDISEDLSPTNLWFTSSRAQTAAVVNSTDNSETAQAPSVAATKSYISAQLGSYVQASTYTAADVLSKVKTVDGVGSGLDADLLDGLNSDVFVQTTSDQSIAGVKTFSDSPIVPTVGSGDSSTKAASTGFVADAIAGITAAQGVAGSVILRGSFDATAATPSLATAKKGDLYTISVAGTYVGTDFAVGDQILFVKDVSGGVVAGTDFAKIDNTEGVLAAGSMALVTLANGVNKTLTFGNYFLYSGSANATLTLPQAKGTPAGVVLYLRHTGTGTLTVVGPTFSGSAYSTGTYGTKITYGNVGNQRSISLTAAGEYKFFCTSSRSIVVSAPLGVPNYDYELVVDCTVSSKTALRSTDDLSEGSTNLYFTSARVKGVLSAGSGISITGGTIANSAPYSDSSARAALSAGTGISYNSSTGAITNSAPYSDAAVKNVLKAGTGLALSGGTFSLNATLGQLTNVSVGSATSGQNLQYNGASWVPATPSTYTDEQARNAVGTALENGNASSTGISFTNNNGSDTISATVSLGGFSIDDLQDVNTSSKSTGQALAWNGTAWVPTTISGGGGSSYLCTLQKGTGTISLLSLYDDVNNFPNEHVVLCSGAADVILPSPGLTVFSGKSAKIIVKNISTEQVSIKGQYTNNLYIFYDGTALQNAVVMPAGYPGFSTTLQAFYHPSTSTYAWLVI